MKDGNLFTGWETNFDASQEDAWYQVDLGSAQDIGSLEIYWNNPPYARDVDIKVSENGTDWDYWNGGHTYDSGGSSAFWAILHGFAHVRYVRFEFRNKTRSTGNRLGGIAELKVYAPGH